MRFPTAAPLTVTEQLETPAAPATRAQEAAGLKASPADEEKVTVPEGLDFVPLPSVSVTVAETVAAWPAASGFGVTPTAVDVERTLICSVRVAVLAWRTPETPA